MKHFQVAEETTLKTMSGAQIRETRDGPVVVVSTEYLLLHVADDPACYEGMAAPKAIRLAIEIRDALAGVTDWTPGAWVAFENRVWEALKQGIEKGRAWADPRCWPSYAPSVDAFLGAKNEPPAAAATEE